jgi:hypothetical protein
MDYRFITTAEVPACSRPAVAEDARTCFSIIYDETQLLLLFGETTAIHIYITKIYHDVVGVVGGHVVSRRYGSRARTII